MGIEKGDFIELTIGPEEGKSIKVIVQKSNIFAFLEENGRTIIMTPTLDELEVTEDLDYLKKHLSTDD
jgi:bifunctional DNA-binding transcriptional regulator/antitoxin component of YhaV-PrlF toxin-antitoxin module